MVETDAKEGTLVVSEYDRSEYGIHSDLRYWLGLDQWTLDEAAAVLLSIDHQSIRKSACGTYFVALTLITGEELPSPIEPDTDDHETVLFKKAYSADKLAVLFRDYCRMKRLIGGIEAKETVATPEHWIENARKKNIHVPWLASAKHTNLLVAAVEDDDMGLSERERATYEHIVGALAQLLWMKLYPEAKKINQSKIIELLCREYYGYQGLKERTLSPKLSSSLKRIKAI